MDPFAIAITVVGFLIAGLVLFYVLLSGATYRHKWATAVRTSERLLRSRDLQGVQRAAESEEEGERLGAVLAIGQDESEEAVAILLAALHDAEAEVRRAAAAYLSQHKQAEAVSALRRAAVEDADAQVRTAAVRSLGVIRDAAATPELTSILQEGIAASPWRGAARRTRAVAAAEALGRIGGSKAAAGLAAAQAAGRGEIRRAADAALRLVTLTVKAEGEDAAAGTLKQLAAMHLMSRDDGEASRLLKIAAEKPDADAEVFHLLGLLYQRQEHWREAETCYQRAIELNPREPFPYFGLGVIYRSRNQTDKALESLRRYVELAPSGQRARAAARMIRELQGRA